MHGGGQATASGQSTGLVPLEEALGLPAEQGGLSAGRSRRGEGGGGGNGERSAWAAVRNRKPQAGDVLSKAVAGHTLGGLSPLTSEKQGPQTGTRAIGTPRKSLQGPQKMDSFAASLKAS